MRLVRPHARTRARARMTCVRAAQVLVVLCISIGRVVWDGWTRFFVAVCHEPEDSFRFVIKARDLLRGRVLHVRGTVPVCHTQ